MGSHLSALLFLAGRRDQYEQGEVHSGIHVRWTTRTIINVVENAAERFYIGCEQDVDLEVYKRNIQLSQKKLAEMIGGDRSF